MEHEGPPAGRGLELERKEDGQYGVFRVAPTPRGDELLTLAKEGYYRGVSPSFQEVDGGTAYEGRGEGRIIARKRVNLREVSLTWRPTYEGTAVIYARTNTESLGGDMTTEAINGQEANDAAPVSRGPAPRAGAAYFRAGGKGRYGRRLESSGRALRAAL